MASLIYANISEKFPCLSKAELISLLGKNAQFKEVASFTGMEIFEIGDVNEAIKAQRYSSTIKSVGMLSLIIDSVGEVKFFECLGLPKDVEVKRIQGMNRGLRREKAVKKVIEIIDRECGTATLEHRGGPLEVFLTDGVVIAGVQLSAEGKGEIMQKNPHNLPFYKPGALNPWYARLLVNLASPDMGKVLLDPFCGTATIPLAASEVWGVESLCSDIRRDMCAGAKKNLESLSKTPYEVIRADASFLPLREGSFSYAVSDPPYNRSVRSLYSNASDLISRANQQIYDLIRPGGIVVLSVDEGLALKMKVPDGFEVRFRCPMYVHNRLTRTIMVMVKTRL